MFWTGVYEKWSGQEIGPFCIGSCLLPCNFAYSLKLVNNTLIYSWPMDNVFAESTIGGESDNHLYKPPRESKFM